MLRTLFTVGCRLTAVVPRFSSLIFHSVQNNRLLAFSTHNSFKLGSQCSLFIRPQLLPSLAQHVNFIPHQLQVRPLTKFSLQKGKRKTVKPVLKRFFRLHWGGWIRTIAGRHKRMWKKSVKQRKRAKQHVFCNATQSYLLDTMVTNYWRRPKYYVEDPYEPYHTREEHFLARRKPT